MKKNNHSEKDLLILMDTASRLEEKINVFRGLKDPKHQLALKEARRELGWIYQWIANQGRQLDQGLIPSEDEKNL